MRLFVALDIPDEIRSRIQRFIEGVSGFAPKARWIAQESLHITLKFIGEQPEDSVDKIKQQLSVIECNSFAMSLRGCGFFPNPNRPRILWIGIDAGPELVALASAVDKALLPLKILPENHAFSPHITLARASRAHRKRRDAPGSHPFIRLQEKLPLLSPPEFGTAPSRQFFLYRSKPSPQGSCYSKLAKFELH